jgi:hypothetical protein
MKERSVYDVIADGDWMHVPSRGLHLACCDCSLTHDLRAKVDKQGRVWVKLTRNNRRTSALRRVFKFTKDDE